MSHSESVEASLGREQGDQEQSREFKVSEVHRILERCSRSSLRTIISSLTLPHGTGSSKILSADYGIVRHGYIALELIRHHHGPFVFSGKPPVHHNCEVGQYPT
jgi:hypothetical protein